MTAFSSIDTGRIAFRSQQWKEAYNHLIQADQNQELHPADLEQLAVSAYLTGDFEICYKSWARAHKAFLEEKDISGAVHCAFWLGFVLMNRGESARGSGWIGRAGNLLEESATDCAAKGYLFIPKALQSLRKGDPESAIQAFMEAGKSGDRFKDQDLRALSNLGQGQALIRMGKADAGVTLLDEAMICVESGELSPIVVGIIFCAVIETCMEIVDLGRAQEWTAALSDWCNSHPNMVPFRGQCLTRRSELMLFHGEWEEARKEANRATDLLTTPRAEPAAGAAFYQLGNIYRLQGDFQKAEEAYFRSAEYGRDPQPGLSLLRLAQGRITDAGTSIRRFLMETSKLRDRCESLLACAEIMVACDELNKAREAVDELKASAGRLEAAMLNALAAQAEGLVNYYEENLPSAFDRLRFARVQWENLQAPYHVARIQILKGLAFKKTGDMDSARMQFMSARSTFIRLKAKPDLKQVDSLLEIDSASSDNLLTNREIEVLQLMADGKSNKVIAEELFISKRTVERHVSNIFTKLDVPSRTAAAAYAFKHGLYSTS